MRTEFGSLLTLLLLGSLTACGMLDGKLSGTVIDARTEKAIEGVELHLYVVGNGRDGASGPPVSATTDAKGHFTLEALCLHPERSIVVSREGYHYQEIPNPFAKKCDSGSTKKGALIRLVPESLK